MPDTTIRIQFGKSKSVNYEKAVKLSKYFTNYVNEDDINILEFSKEELIYHKIKVLDILNLISAWRHTEIIINKNKISNNDVNMICHILKCIEDYDKNLNKKEHCCLYGKEGWRCKFIIEPIRHLPDSEYHYRTNKGKYWFNIGSFDENGKWCPDKKLIKLLLYKEVENNFVSLCPHFNLSFIDTSIDLLPNVIDTKENKDWIIEEQDYDNGFTIEKKKIGVCPQKMMCENNNTEDIGFGLRINIPIDDEEENRNIPDISFNRIGGLDEILTVIREVIELPIKVPELFEYLGIIPHKGILLYGPPGCGKTLIAKAIANEIKAHFISINGPELFSKWVGQSFENLRNIFNEAKKLQPSIIFFDEIDSIAHSRSDSESNLHDSQFVNQLLTLMDGMQDYGNIRVIASTNRPELLDSALLRPGRLDYHIEIKKPTLRGCAEIFNIYTKKMPIEKSFNKIKFAEKFFGYTGADIAFVVRESAYNCIRREVDFMDIIENDNAINFNDFLITENDFNSALMKLQNKTK